MTAASATASRAANRSPSTPNQPAFPLPANTCSLQGVVTKIDLTESGQEMLDRLSGANNNLKLKLGFIPVRLGGSWAARSLPGCRGSSAA